MEIFDINILSKISLEINKEIENQFYKQKYSQLVLNFIKLSSIYNKLNIFLLIKTNLRFSDLQNFDLQNAILQGKYSITQKKTKSNVYIQFEIFNPVLKAQLLQLTNWKNFLNYNSLSTEIKLLSNKLLNGANLNFASATHLFRHLNSSFLYKEGYKINAVGHSLGHRTANATTSYIHQELWDFF